MTNRTTNTYTKSSKHTIDLSRANCAETSMATGSRISASLYSSFTCYKMNKCLCIYVCMYMNDWCDQIHLEECLCFGCLRFILQHHERLARKYKWMNVVYVSMYVCIFVCMYVCMWVCILYKNIEISKIMRSSDTLAVRVDAFKRMSVTSIRASISLLLPSFL